MIIGRYLLVIVLISGALAGLRLAWVTHDYTQSVATLRGMEIKIVDVERSGEDELVLTIELRNRANLPATVDYLHLDLVDDGERIGATFERIPAVRVEPESSLQVPATVGLLASHELPDNLPSSLHFRGEWRLHLPTSGLTFQRRISVVWEQEP